MASLAMVACPPISAVRIMTALGEFFSAIPDQQKRGRI